MDEVIEVVIAPDGTIRYEAIGFEGDACERATQYIKDALSGSNLTDQRTGDFYKEEQRRVSQ